MGIIFFLSLCLFNYQNMMATLTTMQLNSPDRYSEIQLRYARSKCSFEMPASVGHLHFKLELIFKLVVTNQMNIASELPLKAFFRQWNLKHLKADTGVCNIVFAYKKHLQVTAVVRQICK